MDTSKKKIIYKISKFLKKNILKKNKNAKPKPSTVHKK